jgi:hypothetical protein
MPAKQSLLYRRAVVARRRLASDNKVINNELIARSQAAQVKIAISGASILGGA